MDIKKDNAMYMQIAQIAANRSYAQRLKVGCVIVKNNSIISFGWNGMPTGYDNCCEIEVDGKLVTRPEVQHAELNAISKLAYNGYSSHGASIYITHSPCMHCSLLIQKCGIEAVYYHEIYREVPACGRYPRRAALSSFPLFHNRKRTPPEDRIRRPID